jgi:hypothetical protein
MEFWKDQGHAYCSPRMPILILLTMLNSSSVDCRLVQIAVHLWEGLWHAQQSQLDHHPNRIFADPSKSHNLHTRKWWRNPSWLFLLLFCGMKKDMFTLSRGLAMGRSLLRATSHEPPKAQIKGAEWMSTARKKERERMDVHGLPTFRSRTYRQG